MSKFEIMLIVESQSCQLERARAVLSEVDNYFDDTENWEYLPHYAKQILLLLNVAENMLYDMQPKLNEAINALSEQCKEERNGKDN